MARRKKRGRPRRKKVRAVRLAPVHNASNPYVSVVIPAMNERKTIARVIHEASKAHHSAEVIVVANGSTDGTDRIAARMGAKLIRYARPLGHDVGRAIGAREAKGAVILFLDGDVIIHAKDLRPLVSAVANGADVALNKYLGPIQKKHVHSVILAKHAINEMLSRPDLKGSSMTTIPHAISRNALIQIGVENLIVPPLAHTIAIHKGLNVVNVHYIGVGGKNPRRRKTKNGKDPLEKLIVGDHLEAIHWLTSHTNERGNFPDLSRLRGLVKS